MSRARRHSVAPETETSRLFRKQYQEKYMLFIRDHERELRQFEDALLSAETGLGLPAAEVANGVAPVLLDLKPYESISIIDLIKSDNQLLNKIIGALTALCREFSLLVEEAHKRFFPGIMFYGEGPRGENQTWEEGEIQLLIGNSLSFFQDLVFFVQRIYDVIKNFLHQTASMYNSEKNARIELSVENVHFQVAFEHLAEILTVLISLDELIANNNVLREHWEVYRSLAKIAQSNPGRFDMDESKLGLLEKLLSRFDSTIMTGRIFQNCLEQTYDFPGLINVTGNAPLADEFNNNVKLYLAQLSKRIGEPNETNQRQRFMGCVALYVFQLTLFRFPLDKKFFKQIWEMNKKIPFVTVYGSVLWSPADFLLLKIPQAASLIKNDVQSVRQSLLKSTDESLQKFADEWQMHVCIWAIQTQASATKNVSLTEILDTRIKVLLQGFSYACTMSNLVKSAINLHLAMNAPLTKKVARPLCRLVELLKSIHQTFRSAVYTAGNNMNPMIQHLSLQMYNALKPIKDRLGRSGNFTNVLLDSLAAVSMMIDSISGPPTRERLTIFEMALSIATQLPKAFLPEEAENIKSLLRNLDVLANLQERMSEACSCDFLYWNRVLIPPYLDHLYANPDQVSSLQLMMSAIEDVRPMLNSIVHLENKISLSKSLEKWTNSLLIEHILKPLCRDIETDLRLQTHGHLQLDDRNPFKAQMKDLSYFVRLNPILFFDKLIDIKAQVSHYLEMTFYNLTSVALHDWRTYTEMRNLANDKYGLVLAEMHLPAGSLEQGIDVLDIMRKLHIFVASYNYNINNQIFVELNSTSKHLNTLNIRHIANSIRTHGSGIMNTTINFTYQFLKKKFNIFSQFLYDDHIKSRLIRDIRFHKTIKDDIEQGYPFERAEKFNKSIRKLGVTPDGLSYLDQFRILITQLGNAVGFVRMVRSGGLHYASSAIEFVPEISDIFEFADAVRDKRLSSETQLAAKNLDDAVHNLSKNFSKTTDYFKMLVDVFSNTFRDPVNIHLRNFFIIVPPLTVNFVEHMLNSKERLDKKKKDHAAFTDDGFPMGIAYVLKLLEQNKLFDSLRWFKSVDARYADELRKLEGTKKRGKEEEQQSLLLTQRRLMAYRKEFELLYLSLSGAQIFFTNDADAIPDSAAEPNVPDAPNTNADGNQVSDTVSVSEFDF